MTPRRSAPEADATRDLYERYARQIYAYCLHQLGNREEAEDAVQSTFLNAFRGYQRGVDPEFEAAWIYKIAQNVCLTRRRSSSRRRRVETASDLDAMQDYLPAHEIDADELIHLPEALDAMPHQQRKALLLREWQGLSYKEIAAELGLSQAAVETLLFRARRTLAAGLNEEPAKKGPPQRLRSGGDAGSALAILKSLLFTGGAKVATAVVTVAATSVVAATPVTRHAVADVITPGHDPAPAPAHQVVRTPGPGGAPASSPVVLPTHLAPATAAVIVVKPAAYAQPVAGVRTPHTRLRPVHSLAAAGFHSTPSAPPAALSTALRPVADAPAPAPPAVDQPAPPSAPVANVPAPPTPAATPDKAKGDEHRNDAPPSTSPQSSSTPAASPAATPSQAKSDDQATKKNAAAAGAPASTDGGRTTTGLVTATPAPTPAAPAPATDQGPKSDNGKDNGNGKAKHVDLVPMSVVAPAAPVTTTTGAAPAPPPTTTVTTTTTAAPAPAAPPVAQPTVTTPQLAPSDNGNGRGNNGNGNGNGGGNGNGHRK